MMETSDGTPERRPDGSVDFALDWEKRLKNWHVLFGAHITKILIWVVWKGYSDTETIIKKKCLTCEFLENPHAIKRCNPFLQYLFRPLHLLN